MIHHCFFFIRLHNNYPLNIGVPGIVRPRLIPARPAGGRPGRKPPLHAPDPPRTFLLLFWSGCRESNPVYMHLPPRTLIALSGRRESNSDYTHPMGVYYHYTTPREKVRGKCTCTTTILRPVRDLTDCSICLELINTA